MRCNRLVALGISLFAVLTTLIACSRSPADDASRKARVDALYAGYKKDFTTAPEISAEDALALWREGRLLPVDIRSPEERAVSTLPGAVAEQEYLADPQRFAGKTPVPYCTIGYRSGVLAAALAEKGLPVLNMAGGLLGWLHAGGTLVDASGQPANRVHVYGRTWDLAPLAYTSVW